MLKELGMPKFNDIHLLQLGQLMYSCKNSFLHPKFYNYQFYSYNTGNSQAYRLPFCRTNTKMFSAFFFLRAEVFLIKLITKSSTLDRFPPLRKY